MRLLSLILACSGFLFFSLDVSKLLSILKGTTQILVHRFQVSTVLLNAKSYYLAGFSDFSIEEKSKVVLGSLSHSRWEKKSVNLRCGVSERFLVSWLEKNKSDSEWVNLRTC